MDKIIKRFLTGGLAHGAYKNEEACIKKSRRDPFAHGSDPCREYLGEKNCR